MRWLFKIPHLVKDGQFLPRIKEALEAQGCPSHLTIEFPKGGGYSGSIEVTIGSPAEKEFDAVVSLKDWTRFPARIRAAATALRDVSYEGRFVIGHADGVLTIRAETH